MLGLIGDSFFIYCVMVSCFVVFYLGFWKNWYVCKLVNNYWDFVLGKIF